MKCVYVDRVHGENRIIWKDDDDFEDFALIGDKISFIVGTCDELAGILEKMNAICFYVRFSECYHAVPFPVNRVTYIKKCLS